GEALGRTLEIDDGAEERIDARVAGDGGVAFEDALRVAGEAALGGDVAERAVGQAVFTAARHGRGKTQERNGHNRITPFQSLHERSPKSITRQVRREETNGGSERRSRR